MGTLSKLLGIDAANKANATAEAANQQANAYNQEALKLQREQYEKAQKSKDEISEQLDKILSPLFGQLYGVNGMNDTAYQNLTNYLDLLTGKKTTQEQTDADNITRNLIKNLTGEVKTDEQNTADQWNSKYLSLLGNSPDIAFNEGLSQLNRGFQNQKDAVANEMQKRGIAGSGIALNKIAGTEADKARAMSGLQGQRVNNMIENTAKGVEFSNSLAAQKNQNNAVAQQLAGNMASQKQTDLENAAIYSNNYAQQMLGNLMNLLGTKGNLATNNANATSYTNALSNAASNKASQAATAGANAATAGQGASSAISAGVQSILDSTGAKSALGRLGSNIAKLFAFS